MKIPERVEEIQKKFNRFIEKWCGVNFPHLIDSDENDGEEFREELRTALTETDQQARETERLRIKVMLEGLPAFTSCSDKTMGQVSDEAKKPAYGTNYLQREAVLSTLSNPPSQV